MKRLLFESDVIKSIEKGCLKEWHNCDPVWHTSDVISAIKDTPSAQPNVPDANVGDMISRQAASSFVCGVYRAIGLTDNQMMALCEGIEALPTAEHERKKGKWIYGENDGQDGWFCSECGGFVPWDYDYYGLNNINFIADFKTCPFCDAKMVSYTGKDLREGKKK